VYFNPATTVTYYLDVYKNGTFSHTESNNVAELFTIATANNQFGLNDVYTFKARADAGLTFDCIIKYTFTRTYRSNITQQPTNQVFNCNYSSLINVIVNVLDFGSSAPDIKVEDWFSGTLKEFNLTCYAVDSLTYQIEPLEDWYNNGDTIDITPYVDTDEIQVDRAKLYNEISFEWQKSKSFQNVAYEGFNGKEYGDLKELFPNNDGGKYEIKLPFETMLFNNFDTVNNNLQVGYCLTNAPDYKSYIPKPVKLYLNDVETVSFYFNDGATTAVVASYMPFGQSMTNNNAQFSINFGLEIDSLTTSTVQNSLFKTYYEPYLLNLFSSKTRRLTLKCVLPLSVLTKLTLDDAILIRDKKYRINDMTSDLTSGLVQLVLLSDWTSTSTTGGTTTTYEVPTGDADTEHYLSIPINVPKGGWVSVADPIETKFITTVPTIPASFTSAFTLAVTMPGNTTGADRYQTIIVTGYNSSGSIIWTDTILIIQAGSSSYLLTEGLGSSGYILTENLDRILL
jgi:hypothetical protein